MHTHHYKKKLSHEKTQFPYHSLHKKLLFNTIIISLLFDLVFNLIIVKNLNNNSYNSTNLKNIHLHMSSNPLQLLSKQF